MAYSRARVSRWGMICGPWRCPIAPRLDAVSPYDATASDDTPPPDTSSGTGPSVWALRTHEVEWSAVTATMDLRRSSESSKPAKKIRSMASMFVRLASWSPS